MARWADGARGARGGLAARAGRRYYPAGSAPTACRPPRRWPPGIASGCLPAVLRDVSRIDLATSLLGTPAPRPGRDRADTHAACRAPGRRGSRWPQVQPRPAALMCVSSNAGSTFADDRRRQGRHGGCRCTSLQDAVAERVACSSAPSPPAHGRRPHRRHPGGRAPSTSSGRRIWETRLPDWSCAVNFEPTRRSVCARRGAREGDRPRRRTTIDWLALGTGLPGGRQGRAASRRRPPCVDAGAAAVWVSNHGGRQLDRAVATAQALPEVVDAVDGAAEVYVDGGHSRRPRTSLTALALGAARPSSAGCRSWALARGRRERRWPRLLDELDGRARRGDAAGWLRVRAGARPRPGGGAPPAGESHRCDSWRPSCLCDASQARRRRSKWLLTWALCGVTADTASAI